MKPGKQISPMKPIRVSLSVMLVLGAALAWPADAQEVLPFPPKPSGSIAERTTRKEVYAEIAPPASASNAIVAVSSAFQLTIPNPGKPPGPAPEGMVWIPGGEFSMGCQVPSQGVCTMATMNAVNDAQPIHRVYVVGFWMDTNDVTNAKFEQFVKATGYVTIAERTPTKEEFPTAPPENLVAGSMVFTPTTNAVALDDFYQWWRYVHGANWRHPTGPDSDIKGKGNYPVVQVATLMPWLTRNGRANGCPPRRNGNSPRVAG